MKNASIKPSLAVMCSYGDCDKLVSWRDNYYRLFECSLCLCEEHHEHMRYFLADLPNSVDAFHLDDHVAMDNWVDNSLIKVKV